MIKQYQSSINYSENLRTQISNVKVIANKKIKEVLNSIWCVLTETHRAQNSMNSMIIIMYNV